MATRRRTAPQPGLHVAWRAGGLAAVLAASLAGQPAGAQDPGREHVVAGYALLTGSENGTCTLSVSREGFSATFGLRLPAPCRLHTQSDGAPRTLHREDGDFLLVESSAPRADGSADCDTFIQAVRLDRYGPDLAPAVEKVASCPPMRWDDVVFLAGFPRQ